MTKKPAALLLAMLLSIMAQTPRLNAQSFPAPADSLSYRLVGFEVPYDSSMDQYTLEVWETRPHRRRDLKNPSIQETTHHPQWIVTLPQFGKTYYWRVKFKPKKGRTSYSNLDSFYVHAFPKGGLPETRVQVLHRDERLKDLYVFFDNHRALYDLDGRPVWHLPLIAGITDSLGGDIRDLKITPQGTISFLTDRNAYEITYRGALRWVAPLEAPENAQIYRHYHHEFERRADGGYRILGNELTPMPDLSNPDQTREATCSTIMEYDEDGDRTWSWNSCEALGKDDPATHFNAFYFHPEDSSYYASFRNTNTVIKIAYPEGKILKTYTGAQHQPRAFDLDGLFYYQHYCRISSDGYLMLFNNNFKPFLSGQERRAHSIPSVVLLEETGDEQRPLKKVWEMRTDLDDLVDPISSGGGSFMELRGQRYLICTGTPGRNIIVNRKKEVLWNVLTQKKTTEWVPFPGYRASAIYSDELPRLLFTEPK